MGKYAPLKEFLVAQARDVVPMTFAEIEKVLGIRLPASKRYPAWWSNNPSNNPMTREWLSAGYETESVNTGGEKLVFRRVARNAAPSGSPAMSGGDGNGGEGGAASVRHPLFGCMRGVLTISPGVDPTQPADPELADYLDRKYGPEIREPR